MRRTRKLIHHPDWASFIPKLATLLDLSPMFTQGLCFVASSLYFANTLGFHRKARRCPGLFPALVGPTNGHSGSTVTLASWSPTRRRFDIRTIIQRTTRLISSITIDLRLWSAAWRKGLKIWINKSRDRRLRARNKTVSNNKQNSVVTDRRYT